MKIVKFIFMNWLKADGILDGGEKHFPNIFILKVYIFIWKVNLILDTIVKKNHKYSFKCFFIRFKTKFQNT